MILFPFPDFLNYLYFYFVIHLSVLRSLFCQNTQSLTTFLSQLLLFKDIRSDIQFFSVFVSLFFEALVSLYIVDVTGRVPGIVFICVSACVCLAFCYFVAE